MQNATLDLVRGHAAELTEIRRDIHAHPKVGINEHRTTELVARKLEEWGIEVHRGIDVTGVVGVLRNGSEWTSGGVRADMDALPIHEATGLPHASQTSGLMHACGHDGHTGMPLGAAKLLEETRAVNGTVNFIFQPGKDGAGGALATVTARVCTIIVTISMTKRFPLARRYARPSSRRNCRRARRTKPWAV